MRTAFGVLGWKPTDFWNSTLTEFFDAIAGWNEANGADQQATGPTNDQLDALVARYGKATNP
ncbi:phage tail assembly chaperone [Agrobacterium rhizogenes]|nr:phage tail assembly chaperone [Rhizobium rhizogenes]